MKIGNEEEEMASWTGSGWAQPVVSKRWAFACSALSALKRASGYRLFVRSAHSTWRRACGL